ncbi:MAG: thiamine phosphate synthase [Phenylobacterium sp.]|nr:thiamine phosphate synthase [Phenylobacterium sp.]
MPALLFFTDPDRTPDPEAVARRLPRGAGIVFRHFGAPDAEARARRLLGIAQGRGLRLLIGQDWALAARIGADGVHLPERLSHRAGALRRGHPGWLVTSAAHDLVSARTGEAHAIVISPVLPSRSASAGRPLGPARLAAMVRHARRPAYGLGGVTDVTARRLVGSGLVGLAAVDGLGLRT